jgi:hypothetical protein
MRGLHRGGPGLLVEDSATLLGTWAAARGKLGADRAVGSSRGRRFEHQWRLDITCGYNALPKPVGTTLHGSNLGADRPRDHRGAHRPDASVTVP